MVNQYKILSAELSNFEKVVEATNASLNSEGSTVKQNEEYKKGLAYAISQLNSEFNKLVLGEGGLQSAAKTFLNLTTSVLSFVNAIGGLKAVLIPLAGLGIAKTVTTIGKELPTLISKIRVLTNAYIEAATGKKLFNLTTEEEINLMTVEVTKANLVSAAIAGVTVAVGLAIAAYSAYHAHKEKLIQEAEQSADALKEEMKSFKNTKDILNDENTSRTQLSGAISKTIRGYDAEGASLDELNEKRREALELIDKQIEKEAQDWNRKNKGQVTVARQELTGKGSGLDTTDFDWFAIGGRAQALQDVQQWLADGKNLYELYNEIGEASDKLSKKQDDLANSGKELTKTENDKLIAYNEYYSIVGNKIASSEKLIEADLYYQMVLKGTKEAQDEYNKFCEKSVNYQDNQITSLEDLTDAFNDVQEDYGYGKQQILDYVGAHEELEGKLKEGEQGIRDIADAMLQEGVAANEFLTTAQGLVGNLQGLAEALGTLKAAQEEYNQTGVYSLETLDKVLSLTAQYGNIFDFVDGQIQIHNEKVQELIDTLAAKAKQTVYNTAMDKLNALESKKAGDESKKAGDKHNEAVTGINNESDALVENTKKQFENAKAKAVNRGADKDAIDQIIKEVEESVSAIDEAVKGMNVSVSKATTKAAKSASGSHKSAAKKSKDAWLEAYKAEKDALESLYKTNVITAEEYAQKLRELSDKYLTDTADHQKKYAKEIHDAYEAMYTALKKSAKEALDEEEKRLKKVYDDTKDQKSKALKDLKKVHKEEEKAIKREIDALKKQKDAVKDSYDARIKALKSEREEYERQVKLMQLKEEFAKAKATRQYVMDETGRFTYQEDSEAVDQARENLIEEESKQAYERELNALEEARDNAVKIYEERIQALEDHYDAVKEQNDQAEEDLEAHYDAMLEQYERSYNDFKENADKYLNGQMQLTNNENTEWGRRLTNLANFVNEYNRLMNSLNNGSTDNSNNYKGTPSSNNSIKGSGSKSSTKGTKTTFYNAKTGKQVLKPHYQKIVSGKRASGDASIASDGMYLVGDSPNQELVIGSKLNGVPLSLSRGDGVVNAKSTNTLAGILNMIGGIAKPLAPNQTTNNSTSNITISNVSLPNVHNGEEFINCLQHFDIDMMQRSYDTY